MNTPTYNIDRIDGPVLKDVIVTVGTETQRQTLIVLTNKEAQKPAGAMLSVTEKWFNQ